MAACVRLCMSESLSSNADVFRVKARGLQRQMWWKECRVLSSFVCSHCKLALHTSPEQLLTVHAHYTLDVCRAHWMCAMHTRCVH